MSRAFARFCFGAGVATLALMIIAVVPSIAGISTWKWVLAVLGFVLFVLGGRGRRRPGRL
jgi:hypothetical protein